VEGSVIDVTADYIGRVGGVLNQRIVDGPLRIEHHGPGRTVPPAIQ